ncbi:MAG: serine/threonine-protein kinase [Microcoleaceae cyanobacterium]
MTWSNGDLLQAGKYRIIHQIEGSGFGLTYLAKDCFLDRRVVIKAANPEIKADQDHEKLTKRFQWEGQILAKISHPNVVQVIEFFQEAGIPCLVMAYINGETLNQRIREQGPLSEAEAVEYFRKLAAALLTVHQAGVIHSDIHPGNIILWRKSHIPALKEPVLIDFNSAKLLQPTTFTLTKTVNDFAPYEQCQDGKYQPRPTLDIYSLAATLYFAVTGEKPQAAIDRKSNGDRLSQPQKYCPKLSDWLNQAIIKGMAIEPKDRPQSMQEWLGLLHQPQRTKQQTKSSKSSSQSKQKKSQNKIDLSTFPFIPSGFLLLVYLLIGTLVGLSKTEAVAGVGFGMMAVGTWGGMLVYAVGGMAGFVVWVVAVYQAGAAAWNWAEAKVKTWAGDLDWVVAGIVAWAAAAAAATAGIVAGGLVVAMAVALAGIIAGVVAGIVAGGLVVAMAWAMAEAIGWAVTKAFGLTVVTDSLNKNYDSESLLLILGTTSTLGLVLGAGLGWFLKLQGVSLPS